MKSIFCVAALLFSTHAVAGQWTTVDESDVERIEVNLSSVQMVRGLESAGETNVRKVDTRITPKNDAYAAAGLDVDYLESTLLFDCQKPLYLPVSIVAKGGRNDGQNIDVDDSWNTYSNGSTEDKISKAVCRK